MNSKKLDTFEKTNEKISFDKLFDEVLEDIDIFEDINDNETLKLARKKYYTSVYKSAEKNYAKLKDHLSINTNTKDPNTSSFIEEILYFKEACDIYNTEENDDRDEIVNRVSKYIKGVINTTVMNFNALPVALTNLLKDVVVDSEKDSDSFQKSAYCLQLFEDAITNIKNIYPHTPSRVQEILDMREKAKTEAQAEQGHVQV